MKQKNLIFYSQLLLAPIVVCAHIGLADAAVAQRTAVKRAPAAAPAARPTVATKTAEPVVESEPAIESEPEFVIQDKSSQFSTTSSFTNESENDSELANKIRAQRAAADAAVANEINTNTIKASVSGNAKNKCDTDLRKCMTDKCGNDFAKCAGDTDTAWGNKIESCRSKVECSAHEFALFAVEIKADRDMAQKVSGYESIVKCGNDYNSCIATQCGPTFMKCIGKKYGDAAIAECDKIAKKCIEQDSGLVARSSAVFATLRENSEIQVKKDEERLYDLRDKMRTQCKLIGAMFDDRSLDCVYTIDFFANNSDTPYASKKQYAGSTFDCNPDYFGVDVTTFKENAYRLTRSQTAASSAMLGSGVGTAVGAITSGAINRAIDRTKAEKDLKKTCLESGGKYDAKSDTCEMPEGNVEIKQTPGEVEEATTDTPQQNKNKKGMVCTDAKQHHLLATYDESGNCVVKSCVAGYKLENGACVQKTDEEKKAALQKKGMVCTDAKQHHLLATYDESGNCVVKSCVAGYKLENGACVQKTDEEKKAALQKKGMVCTDAKQHHLLATYDENGNCVVKSCVAGYKLENGACVQKTNEEPTSGNEVIDPSAIELSVGMTDEQKAEIAEKEAKVQELKENEQSLENRMTTAVSMGGAGIGGMMLAESLSEQRVDEQSEQDMAAYIETFRCEYAGGKSVKGGATEVQLPADTLFNLYQEYIALAADVKTMKEQLDLMPGIESEVVMDKATMGLYDDKASDKINGTYASLYRVLTDESSEDAQQWADQKEKTDKNKKIGIGVGVGAAAVGGIGNILTNHVDWDKIKEKKNTSKENTDKIKQFKKGLESAGMKNVNKLDLSKFDFSNFDVNSINFEDFKNILKVENIDASKLNITNMTSFMGSLEKIGLKF